MESWEWRWEFLRRTPGYRKLWDQLPQSRPDDKSRSLEGVNLDPLFVKHLRHRTNLYAIGNPGLRDTSNPRLRKFGKADPFLFGKPGEQLTLGFRDNWDDINLQMMWADDLGLDEAGCYRKLLKDLLDLLECEGLIESMPDPNAFHVPGPYTFIRFDLARPLPQQLKTAKSQLEKLAGKRRAPRLGGKVRELWPIYLRVIDAKEQGEKDMEIYRHIFEEAEENLDTALYERMNVRQEAVLIADWTAAAHRLMETASIFL